MQKNVGGFDRLARLGLGSLMIIVGATGYGGLVSLAVGPFPAVLTAVIVAFLGALLLMVGLVQKSPLNAALGINTYKGDIDRDGLEKESVDAEFENEATSADIEAKIGRLN